MILRKKKVAEKNTKDLLLFVDSIAILQFKQHFH